LDLRDRLRTPFGGVRVGLRLAETPAALGSLVPRDSSSEGMRTPSQRGCMEMACTPCRSGRIQFRVGIARPNGPYALSEWAYPVPGGKCQAQWPVCPVGVGVSNPGWESPGPMACKPCRSGRIQSRVGSGRTHAQSEEGLRTWQPWRGLVTVENLRSDPVQGSTFASRVYHRHQLEPVAEL
jgi:hypothetical protein